jgi:hypothetical protein
MFRTERPHRGFVFSHRPAGRRDAAGKIIRLEEEGSARSVRTQRSIRSSRQRTRADGVQWVPFSVVEKWYLIEYRVDSIKHATSPSRRDCSQQVVISREFQIQSIASKHQNRSAASPPRWLSPVTTCSLCFAFVATAVGCANISCSKRARRNAPA